MSYIHSFAFTMMTNNNNKAAKLLHDFQLNENDFSNETKRLFPFYEDILESLNHFGRCVLANNDISSGARYIIRSGIKESYNNVTNVLNYLSTKPLETKKKINEVPMIMIAGLTRTGTTLLHNLMACDPSCRAPLLTDMARQPIPPILRSDIEEHQRRAQSGLLSEATLFHTAQCDFKKVMTNVCASHPLFPTEEDVILLNDAGVRFMHVYLAPKETNLFTWFIDQQNKDFAYAYHRTVLQMLHDVDPPRTHWQLKSPLHTLWIDTLLKYYPQTSLIMCHRRLDEVLPSSSCLWLNFVSAFFNEEDINDLKLSFGQMVTTLLDIWIERLIEFRSRKLSATKIFDIQYEDLMKDPIDTVRRIYNHFDFLEWSDEFEKAMRAWLIDNPQGKQGRSSYSLSEFGLETQVNKQLYKDYEKMFLST